jgi:tetratricopeptide (TPR) repeat protein
MMAEGSNPSWPLRPSEDEALEELISRRESGWRNDLRADAGQDACPAPDVWPRVAAGEAVDPETLLDHAALCSSCAQRLRMSLRLAAEDVSPDEAATLAQLESGTEEWRRRFAGELARTPRERRRVKFARLYLWSGIGLAASLLIGAPLVLLWQYANTAERLLADAYGQTRIFPLRIPGAPYAQESAGAHLRGGSTGREPAKLLEARARIESHLERSPHDPHWLALEARSDILEENFDPAIAILDRLLAAGPVTPGLLADAASAYFERGEAAGSENDRATALDYLRRADELAPGDPVVLFNEAVVMEDRGQVMNAVETWNRFLRFERDPQWLDEGRRRLSSLEQRLNRMKTHASRMEQRLATPEAMRALAADAPSLGAVDEELSARLLPRLLNAAYPAPVDRSRGSPCAGPCQAARALLQALAVSLERNHQDPWLTRLLPSPSSQPSQTFILAAHELGQAIDANALPDPHAALRWAREGAGLFHRMGNAAGEDRAGAESAYALQLSSRLAQCHAVARQLAGRARPFPAIEITAIIESANCDTGPGSAAEEEAVDDEALRMAGEHRYATLEFRARSMPAASAAESGDVEDAWRIDLATIRRFYEGDYSPARIASTFGALAEVEESTPRVHLDLLLRREYVGVLVLSGYRELIAPARMRLAATAIRAGAIAEAEAQMNRAQKELDGKQLTWAAERFLANDEIKLADFYVGHSELVKAEQLLGRAHLRLAGSDNVVLQRSYAAARGELELALRHPDDAESVLRDAILDEERRAATASARNIVLAQEDRDLYAELAAVWLAQKRPGDEILALWERYRLRVLGEPVPACAGGRLDCLRSRLADSLGQLAPASVLGQVVLRDRLLLYRADANAVQWSVIPMGKDDVLAAAAALIGAAGSPATSLDSVHEAARRVGDTFFTAADGLSENDGEILLESDPLLGNLPWAAVEDSRGPIGMRFDIEELPGIALAGRPRGKKLRAGTPLIIGASVTAGDETPLPEVLKEAAEVARFSRESTVLLAEKATQSAVASRLETASAIHFAGHAVQYAGATRLMLADGDARNRRSYLDSELLRTYPPRRTRLVVLSACSSGKREEEWNHGMGDIVNTLAALGVPETVATRWQIDSASAVPMMGAFYSGLASGFTVSHALTEARLSLSRDPRYRHPYYWAAYYASGVGTKDLREVFDGKSK